MKEKLSINFSTFQPTIPQGLTLSWLALLRITLIRNVYTIGILKR